jgi:hypothetical protein
MTTTWRLGEGAVAPDDHGAPTPYVHDQLPINGFLLSQATDSWHTADRCWVAGFCDHGPWRRTWAVPYSSSVDAEGASQRFWHDRRTPLDNKPPFRRGVGARRLQPRPNNAVGGRTKSYAEGIGRSRKY